MARVGRKRKVDAARQKDGRVAYGQFTPPTPEFVQRRCEAVGRGRFTVRWEGPFAYVWDAEKERRVYADQLRTIAPMQWDGTLIGAYVLAGDLPQAHRDAAERYVRLAKRYMTALRTAGAQPPKEPRAQAIGDQKRGDPEDMDTDAFMELRRRYNRATEAIGPMRMRNAVGRALRNEAPHSFADMEAGLDRLAQHFGLLPVVRD